MRANLSISENPPTGAIRATGSQNPLCLDCSARQRSPQPSIRGFFCTCLEADLAGRAELAATVAKWRATEARRITEDIWH